MVVITEHQTFTIDLCNNLNEPANYDELINSKDLYLRVRIMKSPNTAKHFWEKERWEISTLLQIQKIS